MFATLERAHRRILALFLLTFIVFGAAFTVIGAALPQIIRTFHWSYLLTGVVLGANGVGYFVSSFLCGFLVEKFPPRRVLVAGLLLGAAAMVLFARTSSPVLNLLLCFGIGLCQGSIEIVTNLGVVRMEKQGQSRIMNLVHAFFCVGAIAGPAAVGSLVSEGVGSAVLVFGASGIASALLAVVFLFSPFPERQEAHVRAAAERTRPVFREPLLMALTFFLMLYVGAELGVSTWASEFLVTVVGAAPSLAAFGVALFWTGLLAGRLFISFAYHGKRQEVVVAGIAFLAAGALVLMQVGGSAVTVAIGIFLTGLGFSGIYPLVMALVGKRFHSGVAIGTAATGGGIGSFTFPFLMAVLAESIGMRGGFWFYTGIVVLLAVIALGIARRMRPTAAPVARR